ncbi:ATP-binding protein [Rhizobium sp. TRM95111]|uniref:hybrid sensor histidine kinase/response regulator n=1 Tax=Rhizobium alarense TaxID=2846851 RepID=UPI001F223EC2|nr:ATP-binding protein [Rhizobium alarense]MCF3639204.1 ATP-binding protein [Rhizobium alarense]
MSEPAKLQKRLEAEFRSPARPGDEPAAGRDGGLSDAPHPLGPHPDDVDSEGEPEGAATVRRVIAGTGLIFAAFVLATGMTAGFYLSAMALAFAGLAGGVYLLNDRRSSRRQAVHEGEERADRSWERDETSLIVSAVHDMLGDIVVVRTLDGRILRANRTMQTLFGGMEVVGSTCEALGLAFRSQSSPHRYDIEIEMAEGPRVFCWHDITVRDPETGALVVHSIARDVTEERRAEGEREQARLKAERASEAKSRLLATVSHEIRTPLSGILGMSHLIGQTRLSAEQKNYLAGIRQSGHALVQLVDDLLDFSTIEAGRFQLRPTEQPVRPILESVVEMLSARAHEKGIEIGSFVSSDVPLLLDLDGARLRQILYNVVGNAVKFTPSGGVSLETRLEDGHVAIAVADTGPGMSPEAQARIFAEFEQAGSASQKSGGTGLGLAISANILRMAGGSLTVRSVQGQGSTFTIRMPVGMPAGMAEAVTSRRGILRMANVFLFAPQGPCSAALVRTVVGLGGRCRLVSDVEDALELARTAGTTEWTDIIVDNRVAGPFRRELAGLPAFRDRSARRIYLVNPEERTGRAIGNGEGFDSWLIRPLRERSLVEVLRGRMKGIETRDAINDNQPTGTEFSGNPETPGKPERQRTIVLAEDDPVNAMLVRAMLSKAGHAVRVVGDFPALLAACAQGSAGPDLIVTDVNMPGGECIETVGHLRALEPALPIVVLTADRRDALRHQLLAAGADIVLAKPPEPSEFLGEIERLLNA